MVPRENIGKTYQAIRADEVRIGDKVLTHNSITGMKHPVFVTGVLLVGDDIEVYNFGRKLFSTSQGNAVMVEARD